MTETKRHGTWRRVESPTSNALFDVVETTDGPYAVGEEGTVLARDDDGWTVVVEAGPAARSSELRCVAATADGTRIWFAGSSGALGFYDVETGRKYDYTAPEEKTSTWEAIIVAGDANEERVTVANGSGEVLEVTFDDDGRPEYGEETKPGSGSTIPAVESDPDGGYAADTSGNVFANTDGEWQRIGIDGAETNFADVRSTGDRLLVAAEDGIVYRHDRARENWTPLSVGEKSVYALDTIVDERGEERTVAVGESGAIYEHQPKRGWQRVESPVDDSLLGVALGHVDVAVGDGGLIIERTRQT